MCGICGVVDFDNGQVSDQRLAAMVGTLTHRGPDDRGHALLGNAGLGHTRLSIIDLSEAGHQPMFNDDRSIALSYNGEVYNFLKLRAELEREGVQFSSRTDTEVVLRAFEHWGTESFSRLEGMFAFAIWDARKQPLYLVRDRFGIKPLYYHLTGAGIVLPYAEWLRGPLAEYMQQVLLDPSILEWGLVDQTKLEQTISEHCSGRRNHGHILYKLLNLAVWRNAYLRVPAATRT